MSWWPQRGPARNYVEVKVAGVDLHGRRLDPFAVIFAKDTKSSWQEMQRTEIVWEDNNPAFVESFEVPYIHQEDRFRPLRVVIYNKTSKSNELKRNTFIGCAEFTLDRMLCKKDGVIERILRDKRGRSRGGGGAGGGTLGKEGSGRLGYLIICGEEIERSPTPHMYSIQFGFEKWSGAWGWEVGKVDRERYMDGGPLGIARDVGRRRSLRTSLSGGGGGGEYYGEDLRYSGRRGSLRRASKKMRKPQKLFYVIYRAIMNGVVDADWAPVYRSEILDPGATPEMDISFEGATLPAERLYGSDENRGLRFELFHFDEYGRHRALGFIQTSAAAFRYARPGGKLFMVPHNVSLGGDDDADDATGTHRDMILKSATVNLQMLKNGLTTRKGGISSLFVFKATDFKWGAIGENMAENERFANWVDRDSYGRKVTVFSEEEAKHILPRGFGYTGSRLKIIASQRQLQGTGDPPSSEDNPSTPLDSPQKEGRPVSSTGVMQNS